MSTEQLLVELSEHPDCVSNREEQSVTLNLRHAFIYLEELCEAKEDEAGFITGSDLAKAVQS